MFLAADGLASYADILLARHALLPGGVRDEPKECLRRRLLMAWLEMDYTLKNLGETGNGMFSLCQFKLYLPKVMLRVGSVVYHQF